MNSRSTARGLLLTRPTLSMISVGIKLEHLVAKFVVVKFAVEKSKQVGQNPTFGISTSGFVLQTDC
jgi:hypothetical protein